MKFTAPVLRLVACSSAVCSCPRPAFSCTMSIGSNSNTSTEARNKNQWLPLDPNSSFPAPTINGRRYAKDEQYLKAVLDDWQSTITATTTKEGKRTVETFLFIYHCDSDDHDESPLYGHMIRPVHRESFATPSPSPAPGCILLFHTAAGPHDVFLFYKAHVLASQLGCEVLICDVLSDDNGWGWDADRTRYNMARAELFKDNGRLLQARVRAAVRAVQGLEHSNDDGNRVVPLAAIGWCLGAQPILELAQIEEIVTSSSSPSLVGLVTFHGVFRRPDTAISSTTTTTTKKSTSAVASTGRKVLICNGSSDPFVSTNDVQSAQKGFEDLGYQVHVRQFEGAKHGYTNPAQAFNSNDAFGYNKVSATESWDAAMLLLKQQFNIKD